MAEKDKGPQRKDFMTFEHKEAMQGLPRTHENCLAKTGVARPGKTAYERWRRNNG
jgi:hypothetical protein